MDTFSHGGQVELFAKELSCEVNEIIDLSSNINFIKPNISIDFNKIDISSYPTYDKLYKTISDNYGVNTDQIELFNGGSVAIFSLFQTLNLKHCTIYSPAYLEYKKAAITYNYTYDLINKFTQPLRAIKENSFIIFVNPSTPDGKYSDVSIYLDAWKKLECTVLIDESFLDFTNYDSVLKYVHKYDNIYILKSMTKFYACAGVRCGTIISNEKNIQKLRQKQAMWKLSAFDSAYLQAALKDEVFKKTSKVINIKNYLLLEKVLKNSSHIKKVFPSDVNFLLVQLKDLTASKLQEHLKKYKILIRNCSNFDFLDETYVRFAVKDEKSITTLEKALSSLLL